MNIHIQTSLKEINGLTILQGLIFGYKINKSLGVFLEGKYHKYWNRNWHDFSVGFNYVII